MNITRLLERISKPVVESLRDSYSLVSSVPEKPIYEKKMILNLVLVALAGAFSLYPPVARAEQPRRPLDDIQRQVDGLKKEDVAWRKIEWKTCLLDGLQASREQDKPIVLWVFIDRPIDDERC